MKHTETLFSLTLAQRWTTVSSVVCLGFNPSLQTPKYRDEVVKIAKGYIACAIFDVLRISPRIRRAKKKSQANSEEGRPSHMRRVLAVDNCNQNSCNQDQHGEKEFLIVAASMVKKSF